MIQEYVKIFLFLSSYIPLFLVLAIKNYTNPHAVMAMSILILVPFLFLIYTFHKASRMSGEYVEITSIENRSNQFLEYIIAYIIPFLGFNLNSVPDLISVLIIFIMIGVLYIKSDLIYMNPILNLLNYTLYKVNTKNRELMIISKNEIDKTKKVRVYLISKNVGVGTGC